MNTKVTETATKVDFLAGRAEEDRRLLSNIAVSVAQIVTKVETFMGYGAEIQAVKDRVGTLETWRIEHDKAQASETASRTTFWKMVGGSWTQILQVITLIALLGAAFWHR